MASKVSAFNTSGTNQRATTVVGLAFRSVTDGELYVVEGDETGGLPVTIVSGGGGTQAVNLTQVAGVAVLTDYGAPTATAPRVVANISVAGAAVAAGNPVPITPGTGAVFTVTGALTDTQLRASPVPVSVSGVATEAKQDTGNISLASIDSKTPALVSGRQPVDGSGVTQPVSVASLPLPTGAATETTLAGIRTRQDVVGHGSTPTAQRTASVIGNSSGELVYNAGPANSATPRVVLADRQESANTPLAVRLTNGTSFIDPGGSSVGGLLTSATFLPYFQDFSLANLTTTYTQIIASTAGIFTRFVVTNNSSLPIRFATGAAASEVVRYVIMPGESGVVVPLTVAAASRLAIRTESGTLTSGQVHIAAF